METLSRDRDTVLVKKRNAHTVRWVARSRSPPSRANQRLRRRRAAIRERIQKVGFFTEWVITGVWAFWTIFECFWKAAGQSARVRYGNSPSPKSAWKHIRLERQMHTSETQIRRKLPKFVLASIVISSVVNLVAMCRTASRRSRDTHAS